jgi:carbamoyltransferase
MKAKLNKEVKHREPFRPFAPICRLEDADKWFKFGKHTRWMTHNAEVINKIEEIEDIIHNDGTARLQTVTREQNSYIYDILTEMDNQGLVPVIINTSFNRMGEPILNRYSTALKVRNETGLDMIITDKGVLH